MGLGALSVSMGMITTGEMIAFIQLLNWIVWPFTNAATLWARLQQGIGASWQIYSLLALPWEEEGERERDEDGPFSPDQSWPLDSGGLPVDIRDLSFAYNDDVMVLTGVNLGIRPGEVLGVVGKSGSGKSTLVRLLLGLYKPTEGQIMIGTQPAGPGARHLIGYVPQDPFLFRGTIMENIRLGRITASDEEVMAAADLANVTEFVHDLPDGWNTQVGEEGILLSAGQRQRIAIARAFLRQAPVLIMDEPTSSVDVRSEEFIKESILKVKRTCTCIIITHRLSVLTVCDRAVLLADGKLTESVAPDILLSEDFDSRSVESG